MRFAVPFILAAALIIGCRSDKPAAPEKPAESPTPQATTEISTGTRPTIVCFGDSLTAGFGADPGSSYPDFLRKDLAAQGYAYRVVNAGVSGNTTKDGVERLSAIIAMKPAIVVVEFGGNDGLRGVNPRITRDNLAQILQALKASGAKVLLAGITLPPDYGEDYIRQFTANYLTLGKQFNVPVLPFLLKDVYGVEGMMQPDRTHATGAGNEIVAHNVLASLTPLLKK